MVAGSSCWGVEVAEKDYSLYSGWKAKNREEESHVLISHSRVEVPMT
jgi:hypothetical protein